jgi:hypothetical protein
VILVKKVCLVQKQHAQLINDKNSKIIILMHADISLVKYDDGSETMYKHGSINAYFLLTG